MPLVKLTVPDVSKNAGAVLAGVSKIVAAATGKPETYVMAVLEQGTFLMRGAPCVGAFADVRGIGKIEQKVNDRISREICALLERELTIPAANIYLNFTDVPGQNWGTSSGTF